MRYSEETKDEMVRRINGGEDVSELSEKTGISQPSLYKWYKDSKVKVKKLTLKDYEKLCSEEPENEVYHFELVKRLMKIKAYEIIKEIALRFPECPAIQSYNILILLDEENKQLAEEEMKKFPYSKPIQLEYVDLLRDDKRYTDAKNICDNFPESDIMQFKKMVIEIEEFYMQSIKDVKIEQKNKKSELLLKKEQN